MSQRVVVVGGGIGGLATARRAARSGATVTVLEAAQRLGGLVADFEVQGTPLERYYHYLLPGEPHILELLDELDLAHLVEWFPSSIGILTDGRIWPFTTPTDLLAFRPLGVADRLRAGVGALRLGTIRQWRHLDEVRAIDWLTSLTSPAVGRVVWEPLLRAKFGPAAPEVPAAWMWGRLQQRRGARRGTGEELGYLRGGFRQLFDALDKDLAGLGVHVRTGATVESLVLESGRVTGVALAGGDRVAADAVLYTGTLPRLAEMVPPDLVDPRWRAARGLGCMCVVLELDAQLTDVVWTNVCDGSLPFGGIIEHTNLVPPTRYGGRHVVYLSRYFTAEEPVATADVDEEVRRWLDALEGALPSFRRRDVLGVQAFRTPYAAPLVQTPYLPVVAPLVSHLPGLYVATTAQIYPQDRGMSEGVRRAAGAAEALGSGWSCPVCGSADGEDRYDVGSEGSEGGVSAEAFRPSADEYGRPLAGIRWCRSCGHGSLGANPEPADIARAYADAADPVSERERPGQLATADRALARIEQLTGPGRLLDVGCWTGSFVEAAAARGWQASGVEPSAWACERARARGLDVRTGNLDDVDVPAGSLRAVVACDVLEHLSEPVAALERMASLLEPGGVLYLTVPDAGSRLALLLGRRWWSILPMHLQYFTRTSVARALTSAGFAVEQQSTHPKVFSARYYAERAAGFVPLAGPALHGIVARSRWADRLVSPDFGDRMAVLARKAG